MTRGRDGSVERGALGAELLLLYGLSSMADTAPDADADTRLLPAVELLKCGSDGNGTITGITGITGIIGSTEWALAGATTQSSTRTPSSQAPSTSLDGAVAVFVCAGAVVV